MFIPHLANLFPLALPGLFSSPLPYLHTASSDAITSTAPLRSTDSLESGAAASASISQATIVLPRHRPAFAERIDPNLVAFSIEADRWPDWAGHAVGQGNEFTRQVLRNLEERSGVPSAIRVGADSEDRTHLNLSLPLDHVTYPPKTPGFPYPEAERIEIGGDWYRLSHNFAPGTLFTWGLNLKSLNVSETEAQAKHLQAAFTHDDPTAGQRVRLEAVEIGNEPELYYRPQSGGGVSNPGDWTAWSVSNYTSTWLHYARTAAKHLDLSETVLRVGDIQFAGSASGWAPQSIIEAGLLDPHHGREQVADDHVFQQAERKEEGNFARKHVKVYSEHMYQANHEPGHEAAPGVLMDKWHVRGNLSRRAMDVVACEKEGLKFVLGETSTYSSHGSPGTSNTAESALWAIDFLLQSATLGISRAYLSHGVGYMYSSFQPVEGITDDGRGLERRHIMMLYYGLVVVNEAIGFGPLSVSGVGDGATAGLGEDGVGAADGYEEQSEGGAVGEGSANVEQDGSAEGHGRYVVELSTEHPNIVSYGVYEHHALRRIVLVNAHLRMEGEADTTHAVDVHLAGLRSLARSQLASRGYRMMGGADERNAHVRDEEAADGMGDADVEVRSKVVLKRLAVPYTTAVEGLTWAGQDFDTPSAVPAGEVVVEEVHGEMVRLAASSAVLIYL